MSIVLLLVTMITSTLGFAGGGGSDSGGDFGGGIGDSGGGGDGEFTWEGALFTILVILIAIIWLVVEEKLEKRRKRKLNQALDDADHKSTEREKWVHQEAARIFAQYQQDWSDYNLDSIKKYTTDRYFQHASLMLEAIDRAGRRNVVSNLSIKRTVLYDPIGDDQETPITLKIMFKFNGTDGLVDTKTNRSIHSNDARDVIEYWNFIYDGTSLKLDGISQSTESTPHLVESIANFAKEKGLFYSPDWGRLALPIKGQIFDGDVSEIFSFADVNNHVVGKWNDCLVQMYTYSATPSSPSSYYLVGQINVPKSYEGVIIKAKKSRLRVRKPEGYERFLLEWEDFNKRYKVYAASKDALPAFELLNPTFMAKLYDRNLPYNIEVKDNVIYIFAKVREAKEENYAELLNVLSEAFNELKI